MGLDSNRLDKNAEHGNLPLHLLVFWAGKKVKELFNLFNI
jgi:hypothetical protein